MAMEFNEAGSGAVIIGDHPETDFNPSTQEFTLLSWFRIAANQNGNLIAKRFTTNTNAQYALGISACQVFVRIGGVLNSTPSINVDDNQLHHAVGRYFNDGGTLKSQVYIDGVQDGSTVTHNTGILTTARLLLGARNGTTNSSTGFHLTGFMEDDRIYNRALSPDEITIIFERNGHDTIFDGMVGRWMLSEQENGTTASSGSILDTSDSQRNGSPNGSPMYRDFLTKLRR